MFIQIRFKNGAILNDHCVDLIEFVQKIQKSEVEKVSFDFLSGRLALRSDGTYQIFGGLVNYPPLEGE
jgi:hypothetical protein